MLLRALPCYTITTLKRQKQSLRWTVHKKKTSDDVWFKRASKETTHHLSSRAFSASNERSLCVYKVLLCGFVHSFVIHSTTLLMCLCSSCDCSLWRLPFSTSHAYCSNCFQVPSLPFCVAKLWCSQLYIDECRAAKHRAQRTLQFRRKEIKNRLE